MRSFPALEVFALALGLGWATQVVPQSGAHAVEVTLKANPAMCDRINPSNETSVYLASSPSQLWPSYDARVGKVRFTIGVDDSLRVVFIRPESPQFRSPEGVGPEWTYERLRSTFKKEGTCELGWDCFFELPSGWNAVFAMPLERTLGRGVEPGDKVSSFFRRGYCSSPPNTSPERTRER